MPVTRFRSVEDMPPPWRATDDPGNLRAVAMMMALYRHLEPRRDHSLGVRKFRSIQEANADRNDPYRTERVAGVTVG